MTVADLTRRKLVLLRHAKSAWPDVPDHERPLARRGQRDAPVMGRWLRAASAAEAAARERELAGREAALRHAIGLLDQAAAPE